MEGLQYFLQFIGYRHVILECVDLIQIVVSDNKYGQVVFNLGEK